MNYLEISTGNIDFPRIVIAQRVAKGKWYATAKDLSSLLQYSQTRNRAFYNLNQWASGPHRWIEIAALKHLLTTSTPAFRKDMIITFMSKVRSCTKYGIVCDSYTPQIINGRQGTVAKPVHDERINKSGGDVIIKHDPEIERCLAEIDRLKVLISNRKKTINNDAVKIQLETKLEALMVEVRAVNGQLRGLT